MNYNFTQLVAKEKTGIFDYIRNKYFVCQKSVKLKINGELVKYVQRI